MIGFEEEVPQALKIYMAILMPLLIVGMIQSAVRGELFNFKQQVKFYMSYHMEPVNVLIHVIFVPTLLYTALGVLAATSPIMPGFPAFLDYSLLFGAIYAGYYFVMGSKVSVSFGIGASLLVIAALVCVQSFPVSINTYALVHVVSWLVQFYGHGVHEGRAPALLTNLSQALLMAPLFVLFETLTFFGWKKSLHEELKNGAIKMKQEAVQKGKQSKKDS
eukprot:jgi/Bigna1/90796/estExt_fgenesh1_pg.C_790079